MEDAQSVLPRPKLELTDGITAERPPHRSERLRNWMTENSIDACVLGGSECVTQFGGYTRYYGGPSACIIGADGSNVLVASVDEAPIAEQLADVDGVIPYGEPGFGLDLDPLPGLSRAASEHRPLANAQRVGVAGSLGGLSQHVDKAINGEVVDATAAVAAIRLVPDEDQLASILYAYSLCWRAQDKVGELAEPGATELEAFTGAQSSAQLLNGEPIQFLADMPSGPSTAEVGAPLHVAGPRALGQTDHVVADIVIGAGGYWGDSAETHIVGDNPEIAEMRGRLLEILRNCGQLLRPGNTGPAVYEAMEDQIGKAFPEGKLRHHAGHALGLTSFEDPHMVPAERVALQNWMVIALEPGVYVPGKHGARVENAFIVTPEGGIELRDAFGVSR